MWDKNMQWLHDAWDSALPIANNRNAHRASNSKDSSDSRNTKRDQQCSLYKVIIHKVLVITNQPQKPCFSKMADMFENNPTTHQIN